MFLTSLMDPCEKKVTRKSKFTQNEDLKLLELVKLYGDTDWFIIASHMKNRNVRQCRERWCNYLSPFVSNGPWTPEDDLFLCQKVEEFGTKWTKIAPFFKARTDINVKNRWMTLMRHRNRQEALKRAQEQQRAPRDLPLPMVEMKPPVKEAPKQEEVPDDDGLWNSEMFDWMEAGYPHDSSWDYFGVV